MVISDKQVFQPLMGLVTLGIADVWWDLEGRSLPEASIRFGLVLEVRGLMVGMGNWFALRVKSKHEKSVVKLLEARSISTLLPLYSSQRAWSDRLRLVTLPLFPGYVFCRVDSVRRADVLSIPGVFDFVRVGSEPTPIDAGEIESLSRLVASGVHAEPYGSIPLGTPIEITGGPMSGCIGVMLGTRNGGARVAISATLLHQAVVIEVDRNCVEKRASKLQRPASEWQEGAVPPLHRGILPSTVGTYKSI